MLEPQEISDAMLAFPADVSHLLPPIEDVPEEFHYYERRSEGRSRWVAIASQWFGPGLQGGLVPKEGIDAQTAGRHVQACLGSFQPKHEHKIAGCAYLLSLWFERYDPPQETPTEPAEDSETDGAD